MAKRLTEANGHLTSRRSHPEPSPLDPNRIAAVGVSTYEEQLNRDPRWALSEGSRHFEGQSAVFQALHGIADRLHDLGIPYAVGGGMALFQHGLRRFTEDVDILVTKSDLKLIHQKLNGLGYLPLHAKSKNLRDTEYGVRIEFLTTGDFPGDGKPKPVVFPDPSLVSFESDGVRYLLLPNLIELKLASGMTNLGRLKDLGDVLELIKVLDLPAEYAAQLNPYVASKYLELWREARKRYVARWSHECLIAGAVSLDELISCLLAANDSSEILRLEQMRLDGVVLERHESLRPDTALLMTTDPKVAEKYSLIDESEYWEGGSESFE